MNNIKSRKRLSIIVVAALCLTLIVGSFAFFTDRETADATATAGNIDLVWADTSLKAGSNNEFAVDQSWDSESGLVTAGNIINPGDYFDLSYTFTNDGSKSIDLRQRIVLKSSVEMTEDAEEYQLTITGGNDSTAVIPTKPDAFTLVYDLKDIIIDGSKETETGAVSGAYTVRLDFSKAAKNAFMDSVVDIDLFAAAKQHRNTEVADFPAFENMASISSNSAWESID